MTQEVHEFEIVAGFDVEEPEERFVAPTGAIQAALDDEACFGATELARERCVHRLPERGALIEHAPQRINAAPRVLRQRNAPHGFGAAEALELLEKVAWLDMSPSLRWYPGPRYF